MKNEIKKCKVRKTGEEPREVLKACCGPAVKTKMVLR
jgi:hypothetical protein